MISLSVEQICAAINGVLKAGYIPLVACKEKKINRVCTDTRNISPGDLFIALKGPSFDAHKLLQAAVSGGAAMLIVEKSAALEIGENNIVIAVDDTRIALGLLASFVKQQIAGIQCAAITGSNGKTTCKELLTAILTVHAGDNESVLATAGNFNNDIGLPLTLLRLQTQHKFAVVELGANHIGEIAYTSALAKPDVALVNNIMPAHLEGFGSLEGVAKAKAEIWSNLSDQGVAVVNLDANFAPEFVTQLQQDGKKRIGFSRSQDNQAKVQPDIYASDIQCNDTAQASFILHINPESELAIHLADTSVEIQLTLPGIHNVSNALAAASMALSLGCSLNDIKLGLASLQQVAGRVNSTQLSEQLTVIDDTYNANSASVKAGVDLLSAYTAKRVLVCGDMGELGEYAQQEHQVIGAYAQQHHIDKLFTVGNLSQLTTNEYNARSKSNCAEHFSDKQQLKLAISSFLNSEKSKVVVLVKGSRSAKMEEIVAFIKQEFAA